MCSSPVSETIGKLVLGKKLIGNTMVIGMSGLAGGIYQIKYSDEEKVTVLKSRKAIKALNVEILTHMLCVGRVCSVVGTHKFIVH